MDGHTCAGGNAGPSEADKVVGFDDKLGERVQLRGEEKGGFTFSLRTSSESKCSWICSAVLCAEKAMLCFVCWRKSPLPLLLPISINWRVPVGISGRI